MPEDVSIRHALKFKDPLPEPDVTVLGFEDGDALDLGDGTLLDLES